MLAQLTAIGPSLYKLCAGTCAEVNGTRCGITEDNILRSCDLRTLKGLVLRELRGSLAILLRLCTLIVRDCFRIFYYAQRSVAHHRARARTARSSNFNAPWTPYGHSQRESLRPRATKYFAGAHWPRETKPMRRDVYYIERIHFPQSLYSQDC